MTNVSRLLPGLLITVCVLMSACSGAKKEMAYRQSQLLPPLQIPAGLATPEYIDAMKIPPRQAGSTQDVLTTEQTELLEKPPVILQDNL